MDKKYIVLILLLISYFSWIYAEQAFIKRPLYHLSVINIKYFRSELAQNKVLEKVMSLFSHMGDKVGLVLCLQLSFHFQNGAHSFITGTQMCLFVLISQTMKSILREPRPLMIDKDIWINDCKHMEFGNPSSHTFGASFMFISTTYLLLKHYIHKCNYKATVLTILGPLNLIFIFVGLIGFSRVFKGVHSYNQVLSGFM
jgi:hypothetical protein